MTALSHEYCCVISINEAGALRQLKEVREVFVAQLVQLSLNFYLQLSGIHVKASFFVNLMMEILKALKFFTR